MSRRTKDANDLVTMWGKLETQAAGTDLCVWSGVDAEKMMGMIVAITRAGSAVLLGTTSDGGAGTILIFADGQKKRLYGADERALENALDIITEWARDRA